MFTENEKELQPINVDETTSSVASVETTAETKEDKPRRKLNSDKSGKGGRKQPQRNTSLLPGFEEKIVQIKRIAKTTKGGRSMRFSALVVIGDKKGTVGFGIGKSVEVPVAIQKAIKNASKNLHKIKMTKRGTIYHEINVKLGATKVLLKPAQRGTGLIAGGALRHVVELAGLHDVYTKSIGSNTPNNVIRATVKGLCEQYTPNEVKALREPNVAPVAKGQKPQQVEVDIVEVDATLAN